MQLSSNVWSNKVSVVEYHWFDYKWELTRDNSLFILYINNVSNNQTHLFTLKNNVNNKQYEDSSTHAKINHTKVDLLLDVLIEC